MSTTQALASVLDGNASLPQILITVALLGVVVYGLMVVVMKKTGAEDQRTDVQKTRQSMERLEAKADRIITLLESIDRKAGNGDASPRSDDQA